MVKNILLVAVVLLGIGLAVPSTRARIQGAFKPIIDNINGKLVPGRIEAISSQLDARYRRAEGFPERFDAWLRRDYSGVPEDPWGNTYYLQIGRRDFTVGSTGPDGVQGNEDDITVTRRLPGT